MNIFPLATPVSWILPDAPLEEVFPFPPPYDPKDPATVQGELAALSWWKKFRYKRRGFVSVGLREPQDLSTPTEFFLYLCENCGPILTYANGYKESEYGERIECTP